MFLTGKSFGFCLINKILSIILYVLIFKTWQVCHLPINNVEFGNGRNIPNSFCMSLY